MTPASQQTSRTVYRRRRLVAGLAAACSLTLCGLGVRGVLAGPGGDPAFAAGAQGSQPQRSVVAKPGDSLWNLASTAYRADTGPGTTSFSTYLDQVITLNGGTALQPGDDVLLP